MGVTLSLPQGDFGHNLLVGMIILRIRGKEFWDKDFSISFFLHLLVAKGDGDETVIWAE
jgi:hypothetical protein